MTITLSKRLQWAADHIPQGSTVADVGTDHALLPIYLVQADRVRFAVATDVVEGPYTAALTNVRKFGLSETISVRLGDGLSTVTPGEVDSVIIAGMGGGTATTILTAAPAVLQHVTNIVVQPMNASSSVRRYLKDHGFGLAEEAIVFEDGRYYEVLSATRSLPPTEGYGPFRTEEEKTLAEEYGPLLLQSNDSTVDAFFEQTIHHLNHLIVQLKRGTSEDARQRAADLAMRIEFLRKWTSSHNPEVDRT